MSERDSVREKIAAEIGQLAFGRCWEELDITERGACFVRADKILSRPDIAVLHPDQSLPKLPSGPANMRFAYEKAQQDMADWRRVV